MRRGKWHMDETYIMVRGRWIYLYHAIDSIGLKFSDASERARNKHRETRRSWRKLQLQSLARGARLTLSEEDEKLLSDAGSQRA